MATAAVGDWVAFRLSDVYLPGAREVLAEISGDTILVGRIIGSSDSGEQLDVFGLIELANTQRVIVPKDRLHTIPEGLLKSSG